MSRARSLVKIFNTRSVHLFNECGLPALSQSNLLPTPTFSIYRGLASEANGGSSSGGWVPNWLKNKLPAALGGDKDLKELQNFSIDTFASGIKQARRIGGITGYVHGTSAAADPQAQGTLRLFEGILDAMTPEEKADLKLFQAPSRQRVADHVGCSLSNVDDCIARYLWMKKMTSVMAELKKAGKPMPTSIDQIEGMLGNWRQYKTDSLGADGATLPDDQIGPKGQPCPLAGVAVSKNTKCPLTRKAFKSCCGKKK